MSDHREYYDVTTPRWYQRAFWQLDDMIVVSMRRHHRINKGPLIEDPQQTKTSIDGGLTWSINQ